MPIHRVTTKTQSPPDLNGVANSRSEPKARTKRKRRPAVSTDGRMAKAPAAHLDATPKQPAKRKLDGGGTRLRGPMGATAVVQNRLRELEQLGRPVRTDELADLLIELRGLLDRGALREVPAALLDSIRALAQRSIDPLIAQATAFSGPPDFKSIYAEQLGELLLIARGCLPNRHEVPQELAALTTRIGEVMAAVVRERAAAMTALAHRAASSAPAESIREAEGVAASLDADNARLYRYGFDKLPINTDALLDAVRAAAVRYFDR